MAVNIGIMIKDYEFACVLARSLIRQNGDLRCIVIDFRDSQRDKANYSAAVSSDLILTDLDLGGMAEELFPKTDFLFLLHSEADLERKHNQKQIFLYDEPGKISDAILAALGSFGKVRRKKVRKMRMISFISACGGSGLTTTAIGAGMVLQRRYGESVGYQSMSPLNGVCRYLRPGEKSFLNLLYELEKGEEGACSRLNLADSSGECIVPHFDEFIDKYYSAFIRSTEESGKYSFLFLDYGCGITEENLERMKETDVIVFMIPEELKESWYFSEINRKIEATFQDNPVIRVTRTHRKCEAGVDYDFEERIKKDCMEIEKWDAEKKIPLNIEVSEEPEAFYRKEGRTEICLIGSFGLAAGRLAEVIEGCCYG